MEGVVAFPPKPFPPPFDRSPILSFGQTYLGSSVLQVQGEGATLRLPLDRSSAALERLDVCFEKNSHDAVATNPFVARTRSP